MKTRNRLLLLPFIFCFSYCMAEPSLKEDLSLTHQFKAHGIVRGIAIDYENDRLYFGSADCYVYCLDLSGNLQWKYPAKGGVHRLQLLPLSGNILCRGANCSKLLCLSKNGVLIWESPMGNPQQMAVDIERNQIYCVAANSNYLYCLCPNSGKILWYIPVGNSGLEGLYFDEERQLFYVGSSDGFVYCVQKSGAIKWKKHVGDCHYISMDPASGGIFCGSSNNCISCLSPEGAVFWRYFTGGCVDGITIDSEEQKVYCICADGYIYCLSLDGWLLGRYWIGSGRWCNVFLDSTKQKIYCGGVDNCLHCIPTFNEWAREKNLWEEINSLKEIVRCQSEIIKDQSERIEYLEEQIAH